MMGNWGIASSATTFEKIKSEMYDFLHGMNSCCKIDYITYDKLCDCFEDTTAMLKDNYSHQTHEYFCNDCKIKFENYLKSNDSVFAEQKDTEEILNKLQDVLSRLSKDVLIDSRLYAKPNDR